MDKRTSNLLGIGLVAGIMAVLVGALLFIILASRSGSHAELEVVQQYKDTEESDFSSPKTTPSATLAAKVRKTQNLAPGAPSVPEPRFPLGYNFALSAHGGKVNGGVRPELLIDGDSTHYDGGTGYGYTQWRGKEGFKIELAEAVEIDCVRFLLWDIEENRFYRYKLECSDSDKPTKWTMLADKTDPKEECRSWQVIRFEKQKVKQLRLTGTYNSANSGFHVVEFQVCLAPPNGFPLEPKAVPSYVPLKGNQKEDLEF